MRHERLGTLDDPGEITDAELIGLEQSRRDGEPRWIRECAGETGRTDGSCWLDPLCPQSLGNRKVEAEKVAAVVSDPHILTIVGMNSGRLPCNLPEDAGAAGPVDPLA